MTNRDPALPMIALQRLSMHYMLGGARIDVLREVELEIAAGQTVAVAGPSGSGKTSLLLLLAGLERPAAGRVSLDGQRLDTLDRDALADLRRDRIGIVFQSFHLLPSLTALDNVALPLQIAGHADALARAREQLGRVGLGARLSHYPGQLSGGEQQRVAIARALVHRPRVLLADEPTGNLDDHTGALIRELLFELHRDSGTTMVLVTHDLDFAARCDRVLHLHDGRLHEGRSHDGKAHEPAGPPHGRTPEGAARRYVSEHPQAAMLPPEEDERAPAVPATAGSSI
jgi:putative ABC transport system ATP-binding protein